MRKAHRRGPLGAGMCGAGASTRGPKTEHAWERSGGPQKELEPGVGGDPMDPRMALCFAFSSVFVL